MALETGRTGARWAARLGARLAGKYTRDQKLFVAEAMLVNSANVITGGAFLTGLLVLMGADNLLVGIVMSSGGWAQMLSLLSSVIVERARDRKRLLAAVLTAFRLLTTLPVFLPLFLGTGAHTALAAAVMMVAGNAFFSVYNIGIPIFFMDSLAEDGRAAYIYTRMLLIRVAYTVVSVAAGLLLDAMHKGYAGFVIVFMLGLAMGFANTWVLLAIQGAGGAAGGRGPGRTLAGLFRPFRDRRYVRFLLFVFSFFFFMTASTSYTSLYQLEYLHLSYGFITVYNTVIYVIMILMTRPWQAIEERIGKLNLVSFSAMLIASELFVYAFLTPDTLWVIALSPLLGGLGASGFWACVLPYRYELMPAEGKPVYEGWFGFAFGAAGLLGTLFGGLLQGVLRPFSIGAMRFSVFQPVYFMSGALALASALLFRSRAGRDER